MGKRSPPTHPGEVLREEFLVPLDLSPYAVARRIGVLRTRIERLAREETGVTDPLLQTVNNKRYSYFVTKCVSDSETFLTARIAYTYTYTYTSAGD